MVLDAPAGGVRGLMMTFTDLAHYRERFFAAESPETVRALLDDVVARFPDPDDVMARSFCHELATALASEAPGLLGFDGGEPEPESG